MFNTKPTRYLFSYYYIPCVRIYTVLYSQNDYQLERSHDMLSYYHNLFLFLYPFLHRSKILLSLFSLSHSY